MSPAGTAGGAGIALIGRRQWRKWLAARLEALAAADHVRDLPAAPQEPAQLFLEEAA